MLDALVLKHIVKLMNEGCLHDLWLLCSCCGTDGGRRGAIAIRRRVVAAIIIVVVVVICI